ncbi:hypothetical protein KL86DES1_20726 [uncultured Desulfovibrio sp.]|uniref:Uncharacterized protein n=1 Tax=uncultured Desulfovibrio sp. TaxID=167968 RepID=A0A212L4V3_9BACT|nr:hypothetical protein KL86DES1_20726 [uncultured Desulfovibrio sp.]VZH33627.1 conserved protein of unknown function [Desulfovibrio sp. 86]
MKLSMGKLRGRCARLMVRLHFHQNGVPLAFQGTTVRSNRDYFTLDQITFEIFHISKESFCQKCDFRQNPRHVVARCTLVQR